MRWKLKWSHAEKEKWYFTCWRFIYSTFASTEAGLHFAHHPMIRGYKAHIQVFVRWLFKKLYFREDIILSATGLKFQFFFTISFITFLARRDIFGFHTIRNKCKIRIWRMGHCKLNWLSFLPLRQQSAMVSVFHTQYICPILSFFLIVHFNDGLLVSLCIENLKPIKSWLYTSNSRYRRKAISFILLCEPKSLSERRESAKISHSVKVDVKERLVPANQTKDF